ncbi:MAG: NAD(P)/FAD-dependent oxidoreductase [Cyanobacteria bacterium J06631_12]
MGGQGLNIAVVGGGAAGYFGAIAAAAAHPEHRVTLYEAGSQPLAKVRISGGGRCNVTHHCFDPAQLVQNYPRGGKALRGAFSRFQPKDTVDWFASRGVKLKTEADGRMFPVTDDSATVIACLSRAAERAGVQVKTRSPIVGAVWHGEWFELTLKSQQTVRCDRLLLTTGSSPAGHRIARNLGHTLMPPVPSLFTFNVADKRLHQLSGVAVNPVAVRLKLEGTESRRARNAAKALSQRGPLLITHWGFSGPAVLKLSAWGARLLHERKYKAQLVVNWLPDRSEAQLSDTLQQMKQAHGRRAIATHSPLAGLSKRLWQYLLLRLDMDASQTWATLSKKQLNRLVQTVARSTFDITGKGVFKDEFVTCGGVSLKEVDFKTMESRLIPGLYFSGEILDIDGVTGGFNFQSAWTTSWLAGQAIGLSAQSSI